MSHHRLIVIITSKMAIAIWAFGGCECAQRPFSPLRRASGAAGYRPDRAEEGPCAMPRQFHLARGPGGKGRGGC